MNDEAIPSNISPENEDTLQELSTALDLYEGEFKLLLARCNYQDLRDRLTIRLQEIHPQPIQEIKLPRSQKDLYTYIISQVQSETPAVLAIVGMAELDNLQAALLDININREMFRNNCPYPIVWWISDAVHKRIIKVAPDFESWTTTLEFSISTDELLASLHDGSEALFRHVLAPSELPFFKKLGQIDQLGSIQCSELETALKDLGDRGLNLEPKLQANLNFIRGLDTLPPNNSPAKALQYLEASLEYWQKLGEIERCGLLLSYIGRLHYQINSAEKYRTPNWEVARSAFQASVEAFEKANRQDLAANIILRLVIATKRMSDWEGVEAIVQKALPLHLESQNAYHLSLDYQCLAEISIQKQEWEVARTNANMAISFLTQVPEANQEWRNLYLFTLAQAEIKIGNERDGLQLLLDAKELGDSGHPKVNISILEELRSLYTTQKQYLEAYVTKQEQYAIEQQYGFRGFIGAGRLQGKKSVGKSQTDVATEIEASGRKQDLDELITRIAKPSYKLIVLYGKSGVGKSSLVNAGLIPQLERTNIEGKDVCAIAIRVYTNWEEELEKALKTLTPQPTLPKGEGEKESSLPSPSGRGAGGEGIISKLREKEAQNLRLVLIFDQFEEFFFVYYNQPTERRRFFEFVGSLLNDSQNLSSLKVVLSLREDYLHYLLECNQIKSMAAIDQDILSKNVLYRVGNLKVEAAKALIQTLTEKSRFYLEPELIGAIADDLKDELGEVRPIELQVVGAQLQQEGIKTLEQYRLLGVNPKSVLVERYLNDVIVDCGEENERLAKFLLFMLTDERGTRPLKTREELEKDLHDLLAEMQGDTSALDLVLEIFVRSGLVVLIPESPLDRYQLVHDYLAELIRASQAPEMAKLQQELVETKGQLQILLAKSREELQRAEIAEIEALSISCEAYWLAHKELEAMIAGVKAANRILSPDMYDKVSNSTKSKAFTRLWEVIYGIREHNRFEGHSTRINSIAFAPNGKMIASGSNDNTIKLWSIEGKELITFKGHTAGITSVAFSPDGKMLASGSDDNTIKLWTIEGKELTTIKGHSNKVLAIAFSPNGKMIASSSHDHTIKLWDLEGRELIVFTENHDNEPVTFTSLTFSPNGKIIASAFDNTIKVWNLEDPTKTIIFKGHGDIGLVNSAAFSPYFPIIASGSTDNTIKLWNLEGKELATLTGHSSWITSVIFSPNGDMIASGSLDKTIKLWNLEGEELMTFTDNSKIWGIAFSPDSKMIASCNDDNKIKLWSLQGSKLNIFAGSNVNYVVFSPDCKTIAFNCRNEIKLKNLDSNSLLTLTKYFGLTRDLAFSPNGKMIVYSSSDNTIKLLNIESEKTISFAGHSSWVNGVIFSPNGKMIASGSNDNTIKLWNLQGEELLTMNEHEDSVNSVIFSPDSALIISSSDDNTIRVWNLQGTQLLTINDQNNGIKSLALSPDGKVIASGGWLNTIKLWDLEGKELRTLTGHKGSINSLAFSPNGKVLASGSNDSTIKLWDLEGKGLQTLRGHYDINSMAFSSDGKMIASSSFNGTIRLWKLEPDSAISEACDWLRPYLTNNPNISESDRHLCDIS